MAAIRVAVQALTGLNSSGSWPPMLFAVSQTMNQMSVIADHPKLVRAGEACDFAL